MGRKKFTIEEICVEIVVNYFDLIAIADKFVKRRKWTINQINFIMLVFFQ